MEIALILLVTFVVAGGGLWMATRPSKPGENRPEKRHTV
jgi:hypothetical protein